MLNEQPQKVHAPPDQRCYRVHSIYYPIPSMSRAERPIKRRVRSTASHFLTTSGHPRLARHTAVAGRFFVGVLDGISTLRIC